MRVRPIHINQARTTIFPAQGLVEVFESMKVYLQKGFAQKMLACDEQGRSCYWDAQAAVQWSLLGALYRGLSEHSFWEARSETRASDTYQFAVVLLLCSLHRAAGFETDETTERMTMIKHLRDWNDVSGRTVESAMALCEMAKRWAEYDRNNLALST